MTRNGKRFSASSAVNRKIVVAIQLPLEAGVFLYFTCPLTCNQLVFSQ
jgi:hypothetical protein